MFALAILAVAAALLWGLRGLAYTIGLPSSAPLPDSLWIVAVLVTAVLSVAVLGRVIQILLAAGSADGKALPIARVLIYGVLIGIAGLFLIVVFGGNPLTLITTSAVFSVFAGIALQPTMSALFSGAVLQFEDRIVPGAWIEVDGLTLQVETTSWRAITGRTINAERVILPNQKLIGSTILRRRRREPVRSEVCFRAPLAVPPHVLSDIVTRTISLMPSIATTLPVGVAPVEFRIANGSVLYRLSYAIDNHEERRDVDAAVLQRLWYVLQRHALPVEFGASASGLRVLSPDVRFTRDQIIRLQALVLGSSDPALDRVALAFGDSEAFLELLRTSATVLMFGPQEPIVMPVGHADDVFVLMDGDVHPDQQLFLGGVLHDEGARPLGDPLPVNILSPFATLASIAQRLADKIGPAADTVMRHLIFHHVSIDDLCVAASNLIPDTEIRAGFLAEVRSYEPKVAMRPGLVFAVDYDLTELYRPVVPLTAGRFATIVALPRAVLASL